MNRLRFFTVLLLLLHFGANAQIIESENDLGATIFNPFPLCATNGATYSNTLPTTLYGVQPIVPCNEGTPENIVWYSFIPCSNDATITITPSDCPNNDGIQSGIYQSTNINSGTSRLICEGGTTDLITLTSDQFVPGNEYYLMLDGYFGDMCDYTITFVSGFLEEIPSANDEDIIQLQDIEACEPHKEFLQIRLVDFLASDNCVFNTINKYTASELYQVTINAPGVTVTQKLKTRFANNFDLEFPTYGTYDIEVFVNFNDTLPLLNCLPDFYLKRQAIINKIDTTISYVYLCENELPYDADTFIYNDFGQYEFPFLNDCGVSVVNIEKSLNDTISLGTQYICANSCFDLGGQQLCDEGQYTILTDADCNEYSSVTLLNNNVSIDVNQDIVLNCTFPSVLVNPIIQADRNISVINWYKNNVLLGTGPNYSITEPGTYIFEVLFEGMPLECAEKIELYVTKDEDLLDFDLNLPILTCANPEGKIDILTSDSYVSYEYSGNILQGSNLSGPVINQVGNYTFTLIGPNGCRTIKNITIEGDFKYPNVDFVAPDLTCVNLESLINYQSDITIVSQEWTQGNNVLGTQENYLANSPGVYNLHLEAENGCELDTFVTLLEVRNYPLIDIQDKYIWYCNTNKIEIINNASNSSSVTYTWSSQDASILPNQETCIVNSIGEVFLSVVDNYTGCETIDTILIQKNLNTLNGVNLDIYSPKCEDEEYGYCEILNIEGGTVPYDYYLNGNLISVEKLSELQPGLYELEVLDANNCFVVENFEIEKVVPFDLWGEQNYYLKFSEQADMEVNTDLEDSLIATLEWFDSNGFFIGKGNSLTFGENRNEKITVLLESIYGCLDSLDINLEYSDDIEFIYPNIFSPNGDSRNDYFSIIGKGPPHQILNFKVFDRFGGLMYNKSGSQNAEDPMQWDGKFGSRYAQPGVYVFAIEYITENGNRKIFSGDITVVR